MTPATGLRELRCPVSVRAPAQEEEEEDNVFDTFEYHSSTDKLEKSVWFQVELKARLGAIDAKLKKLAALERVEAKVDQVLKLAARESAERPVAPDVSLLRNDSLPVPRSDNRRTTLNTLAALRSATKRRTMTLQPPPMLPPPGSTRPMTSPHAGRVVFENVPESNPTTPRIDESSRCDGGSEDDAPSASGAVETTRSEVSTNSKLVGQGSSIGTAGKSTVTGTVTDGIQTQYNNRKSKRRFVEVWHFFEDEESSLPARLYARMMLPFIVGTVILSLAHAIDEPIVRNTTAIQVVEVCIEVSFAIEVLFRVLSTPSLGMFLLDAYNIIDIVSALPLAMRSSMRLRPFSADGTCGVACSVLLGMVPVVRLLKLLRRFQNFQLLLRAFKLAFEALPVLLFIWAILGLAAAAGLYLCEPRENVATLGVSIWLSVVSMTTLGYGDFYPVSVMGRLIVCVLVLFSGLYMAIPLGIIGSAFSEVWNDRFRILLTERTRKRFHQAGYEAHDIPFLFQIFDANKDNSLDVEEFKMMVEFMQVGFRGRRVVELFDLFDVDGSGSIDDREFVKALFPESYHEIYGAVLKQSGQACLCCGNIFMQDSKFCRQCGSKRPVAAPSNDADAASTAEEDAKNLSD
mmetsp:Transcript_6252/g.17903  ORF Transcript_6252/g.17903 Transcript_6252/m.17903 type:complete len:630 (-) Transcript_6252:72-1961(-)